MPHLLNILSLLAGSSGRGELIFSIAKTGGKIRVPDIGHKFPLLIRCFCIYILGIQANLYLILSSQTGCKGKSGQMRISAGRKPYFVGKKPNEGSPGDQTLKGFHGGFLCRSFQSVLGTKCFWNPAADREQG